MRPKTATNAQMSKATTKSASQSHMPTLDISCTSACCSLNRGPSRKGQDCSSNPPAQARNEDEKRECWMKANALEDFPAWIDDQRGRDEVIKQTVMFQLTLLMLPGHLAVDRRAASRENRGYVPAVRRVHGARRIAPPRPDRPSGTARQLAKLSAREG